MSKHFLHSLSKVLEHFENNAEPTSRHESNFSTAIGLFPDGGCRSEDSAPTVSKRKAAFKLLKRIQDDLGFDMFLLCSFTFSQTALYGIKKHEAFLRELQQRIKISSNFRTVAGKYKERHKTLVEDDATATDNHNKVVHLKRRLGDTELEGGEPTPQARRMTLDEDDFCDVATAEPTNDPLLSDGMINSTSGTAHTDCKKAPLTGKVYKLGVLNAVRLLAVNRETDLQVLLTMPDSEQWPFVTFRCDPKEAMRLLTELEQIM
ncbi:hypothetical protein CH63R_10612 [Colletotrichum higginsianum IMI 349063]|uniref:Uncharacterized protein n=2 Tax=Colletotrichum destructivum species complex TaxID=2707350 RepID=A0A1B7Y3B4_COLHI|nr:uncharacterized protein CH63R_10612 [Colletotrichum higginsianum IMI 349063]OBR06492.1 hypothetical protein CH63R_10612 [Colletotrichum higginsianum IMI 349063]WQF76302.1 hypothetical protein CDEST_01316 [Colletotrichum destructivum]